MQNIDETKMKSNFFTNLKNKIHQPLSKLQLLIIFFFIYSIIGWCLESIYAVYELGHFTKRGFLFGPLCPIYGYGAIIVLLILKPFNKNNITLFISGAIILSIFEYLVGYGLDAMFAMKFWDYTNEFLNINGRITLWFAIIWGIFGVLFINYIHPKLENFINKHLKKINLSIQHVVLYLFVFLYIADTLISTIKYML